MQPESCNPPSAGQGFVENVPVVTGNAPLLWVLKKLLKTYPWLTTSEQTVAMDMKKRTLHGGDSYPSRLAGIKGGQLRSHQLRKQNTTEHGRRSDSTVNQRVFKNKAELRRGGFVIQTELSV
jgi:hypothetical protein